MPASMKKMLWVPDSCATMPCVYQSPGVLDIVSRVCIRVPASPALFGEPLLRRTLNDGALRPECIAVPGRV